MRLSLAALTILFVAYVPVFAAHVVAGLPLPRDALRLSSAAHLVLEFVLGFGAVVTVLERAHHELHTAHRQLRDTADRDELTQVLNRRALIPRLEAVLADAVRARRQACARLLESERGLIPPPTIDEGETLRSNERTRRFTARPPR